MSATGSIVRYGLQMQSGKFFQKHPQRISAAYKKLWIIWLKMGEWTSIKRNSATKGSFLLVLQG